MVPMDAFEILVVILSVMLAIGLFIGIVIGIYLFKLVKNLKEISEKAKDLVTNAGTVAATMKKAAAPTVVAKFVADQISNAVKKHSNSKEK